MFSNLKEFKKIFRLAFPERPEDKLELLTTKVANVEKTDGKIRECYYHHDQHHHHKHLSNIITIIAISISTKES